MLKDGLAHCARATLRDTPCTPTYFFRISCDQSAAEAMASKVKTIGDHPHHAKAFKSIAMGTPKAAAELKLKTDKIENIAPLSLDPSTPTAEAVAAAALDFAPVAITLSEYYMDTAAFFGHASSPDFLKAHAVVMEGALSLEASTHFLGTPTEFVETAVLAPVLSAKKPEEELLFLSNSHFSSGGSSGTNFFLEFLIDVRLAGEWKGHVEKFARDFLSATVVAAFAPAASQAEEEAGPFTSPSSAVRIEIAFSSAPILTKSKDNIKEGFDAFFSKFPSVIAGQLFVLATDGCAADTAAGPHALDVAFALEEALPSGAFRVLRATEAAGVSAGDDDAADQQLFYEARVASSSNDAVGLAAGYALHPKVGSISASD